MCRTPMVIYAASVVVEDGAHALASLTAHSLLERRPFDEARCECPGDSYVVIGGREFSNKVPMVPLALWYGAIKALRLDRSDEALRMLAAVRHRSRRAYHANACGLLLRNLGTGGESLFLLMALGVESLSTLHFYY